MTDNSVVYVEPPLELIQTAYFSCSLVIPGNGSIGNVVTESVWGD